MVLFRCQAIKQQKHAQQIKSKIINTGGLAIMYNYSHLLSWPMLVANRSSPGLLTRQVVNSTLQLYSEVRISVFPKSLTYPTGPNHKINDGSPVC